MKSWVNISVKKPRDVENVMALLNRVGFHEDDDWLYKIPNIQLKEIKSICIFSSGMYQLLNFEEESTTQPKDLMNSKPVKYFLEHNHV